MRTSSPWLAHIRAIRRPSVPAPTTPTARRESLLMPTPPLLRQRAHSENAEAYCPLCPTTPGNQLTVLHLRREYGWPWSRRHCGLARQPKTLLPPSGTELRPQALERGPRRHSNALSDPNCLQHVRLLGLVSEGAAAQPNVLLILTPEVPDAGDDVRGGEVAESAERLAQDVVGDVQHDGQVLLATIPGLDPLHHLSQPSCAFATGGALPARLMTEEFADAKLGEHDA